MEERDDQFFQMVIQIGAKYRGSFNTLLFGDIKPYTGFLKNGRLDLVYYRDPGLSVGDRFPPWTFTDGLPIVLVLPPSPGLRRGKLSSNAFERSEGVLECPDKKVASSLKLAALISCVPIECRSCGARRESGDRV